MEKYISLTLNYGCIFNQILSLTHQFFQISVKKAETWYLSLNITAHFFDFRLPHCCLPTRILLCLQSWRSKPFSSISGITTLEVYYINYRYEWTHLYQHQVWKQARAVRVWHTNCGQCHRCFSLWPTEPSADFKGMQWSIAIAHFHAGFVHLFPNLSFWWTFGSSKF